MGDGDETGGSGERRTDRLVLAHLEISEVDGHPRPLVHDLPGGLHGVDRLAEDGVARGALGGQFDAIGPARRRRQLRLTTSERELALGRISPSGVIEVDDDDRTPAHRGTGDREQGAVLVEDASLQVLQLGRGINTEPLGENGAGVAERPKSLALPARPVERQHVEGAEVLSKRMLDGQRVELGDDLTVPSRPQVGVDPVLESGQAQLCQTGDLTVEEAVRLDVGVRMASPHRQCLA